MEAVIDLVDSASDISYAAQHRFFKKLQGIQVEPPFGNTWLIRNDGSPKAYVVQQANRLRNAREQLELRRSEGSVNHTHVLVIYERIDHPVAV